MIEAAGLGIRYESRWVLRGIDLDLSKGQALAVLGHNGSGKSTLLKILAGLAHPTEGKVHFARADSLGYYALDGRLYPTLTVREHLTMAGELRRIDPRTGHLIEQFELRTFADQWAGSLSTGMRNRVKLALAAQADPDVLLLDEPGAGLDEKGRALVENLCRDQVKRGVLVIASNDPFERRLATHELVLGAA